MAEERTLQAFSDEDADLFRAMVASSGVRQVGRPALPRTTPQADHVPDPGCYVVLTPAAGIPAMWEETAAGGGTGTGTQGDDLPGAGTGTLGDQGDRPGFADCDAYLLHHNTPSGRALHHPRLEPLGFTLTVYNPSFTAVRGGRFVTITQDPFGDWWAGPAAGSSSTGFWARLTNKTFTAGRFIAYSWEAVRDADAPTALTWTDTTPTGGPGALPAYEVNNVNIVVARDETPGTGTGTATTQDDFPTIVWLWPSAGGTYYLFEETPRWEFVSIGGNPLADGTYPGFLLAWDQDGKRTVQMEEVYVFDVNAFVPP